MIENSSPIFVDTNIPMYAVGKDHPLRSVCRQVMDYVSEEAVDALTDVEVHQEILHRYLSLKLPEQARQLSLYFQQLVPTILPITLADLIRARELGRDYPTLRARDLIHVAVMVNNGLTRILSADAHFDVVAEIERIPPDQFAP
jgi:predicted nucleic acid-binding protein